MIRLACLLLMISSGSIMAQLSADTLYLWPNQVPGEEEQKQPMVVEGERITNVTNPLLTIHLPDESNRNGVAVIINPGGGYHILAHVKEGYEVASWLNDLGYVAFVLHYRVPQKQEAALMDAQRAIRMVRGMADQWGVGKDKIGMLGFSAGGSLTARASTRFNDKTYKPFDNWDELSARPDFSLLIYPAYLDHGEFRSLTPELSVDDSTSPMFIFETADDNHGNSALVMAQALRDANVPVELHFLPEGGHGYGLRKGNQAAEKWPEYAAAWLNTFVYK